MVGSRACTGGVGGRRVAPGVEPTGAKSRARSPAGGAKVQAVVELATADLVQVETVELVQGLAIAGPLRAANSAFVKARVAR